MTKERNYLDLFRNMVKLLDFPDNFLIEINNVDLINQDVLCEFLKPINHFPVKTIVQFTVALIYSYPNAPFVPFMLNYLGTLQFTKIYFKDLINALNDKDMMHLIVNSTILSTELLCEDDLIRLRFIKYYILKKAWFEAVNICTYLYHKPNRFFYHLLSSFIYYIVEDYDSVIPYLICKFLFHNSVYFDDFILENTFSSYVLEIIKLIIDTNKSMIDIKKNLNYAPYFIISLIICMPLTDLQNLVDISETEIIECLRHMVKCFTQTSSRHVHNLVKSVEIISKQYASENAFYENLSLNLNFFHIFSSFITNSYDNAYSCIQDIVNNHMDLDMLKKNSFWNLLSYILSNCSVFNNY
ncbi:hypothetical protein HZS_6180 [Henneguya salminicola]|nr:hypothetical protein HZS_6180 [Henneguya salminicola]